MTRSFSLVSCAAWGFFGSACGGAMQQGSLPASEDTDKGGLLSSLDAPLAVGASVRPSLRLGLNGSQPPPLHFVSVSPGVLSTDGTTITGRAPGLAALLATTDDGTVVEFVHVWVETADHVDLHAIGGDGADLGELTEPYQMVVGESFRVVPRLRARGTPLAGVSSASWSIDPPILTVLKEGLPQRSRVLARAPGKATLRVSVLGAVALMPIEVVP